MAEKKSCPQAGKASSMVFDTVRIARGIEAGYEKYRRCTGTAGRPKIFG
jgi:hypothetical protein